VDVVLHCRKLLSQHRKIQFLDPGFGTGSFYSGLLQAFPAARIERAEGFEIDPHYGRPAMKLWEDKQLKVHLADFTESEPPSEETERFNLVICNPPYVRHHHIANGEKRRLQKATEQACAVKIGGLAGLYCYFLGLTHPWMARNGIAAWLIPSEFMDVNYGKSLKHYLLTQVTLLRIHRFDPNDVQFSDALVSSAVVWFRKAKPKSGHSVEFTFGRKIAAPRVSRKIPAATLNKEPKWTRFPLGGERKDDRGLTLAHFFAAKRGLATGHNKFFILTREEISKRRLPMECFRPILPSPRYLPRNEVRADADGNPVLERQVFLLDCRLPEAEVQTRHPSLWAYLEEGRKQGVKERYLCKHRSPWYAQEHRPPTLFLCTYLGRINVKTGRSFRFILNHSQATAANVYLLLYPKAELAQALQAQPKLALKIWQALNQVSQEAVLGEGRVYGGGLHKLEPSELENIPADAIGELLGVEAERYPAQPDLFTKSIAFR
jgi:hypothetical protein